MTEIKKQVDKSHYGFHKYLNKARWASMWHQLDEVIKLKPSIVLEIGPGPGIFKNIASLLGIKVETFDIDPELHPDHVGSVFQMPFEDKSFDVVCAFQMLEHLPFEQSLMAFREMRRVSKFALIISLPDAAIRYPLSIQFPKFGTVRFSIPKPRFRQASHSFDGQHYWEINKAGFNLSHVTKMLIEQGGVKLLKTYRVHENLYHRFMIFEICD